MDIIHVHLASKAELSYSFRVLWALGVVGMIIHILLGLEPSGIYYTARDAPWVCIYVWCTRTFHNPKNRKGYGKLDLHYGHCRCQRWWSTEKLITAQIVQVWHILWTRAHHHHDNKLRLPSPLPYRHIFALLLLILIKLTQRLSPWPMV